MGVLEPFEGASACYHLQDFPENSRTWESHQRWLTKNTRRDPAAEEGRSAPRRARPAERADASEPGQGEAASAALAATPAAPVGPPSGTSTAVILPPSTPGPAGRRIHGFECGARHQRGARAVGASHHHRVPRARVEHRRSTAASVRRCRGAGHCHVSSGRA